MTKPLADAGIVDTCLEQMDRGGVPLWVRGWRPPSGDWRDGVHEHQIPATPSEKLLPSAHRRRANSYAISQALRARLLAFPQAEWFRTWQDSGFVGFDSGYARKFESLLRDRNQHVGADRDPDLRPDQAHLSSDEYSAFVPSQFAIERG